MDLKHLVQAERHLAKAHQACERIQAVETLDDMEGAWSDFIMAVGTVYNKLEGGSRGCPKSRTWWLNKKADRKKDPFLNYVFQARNADEHGIVEVAAKERVGISATGAGPIIVSGTLADIVAKAEMPGSPLIVTRKTEFRLTRVTNSKFGDHFDPPRENLPPGRPFRPAAVALVTIDRLDAVIGEARELAQAP